MGLNREVPEKNIGHEAGNAKSQPPCHGTTKPGLENPDRMLAREEADWIDHDAGLAATSRYLAGELRTGGLPNAARLIQDRRLLSEPITRTNNRSHCTRQQQHCNKMVANPRRESEEATERILYRALLKFRRLQYHRRARAHEPELLPGPRVKDPWQLNSFVCASIASDEARMHARQ
jgi:hypothetical protein